MPGVGSARASYKQVRRRRGRCLTDDLLPGSLTAIRGLSLAVADAEVGQRAGEVGQEGGVGGGQLPVKLA